MGELGNQGRQGEDGYGTTMARLLKRLDLPFAFVLGRVIICDRKAQIDNLRREREM